ncbi:MAG: aspartyl protease family protein [Nitrososphaerales archaeon]
MGHIIVKIKIGDPDRSKVLEVEGLVDTGATLTVVPYIVAEELGLKPTGSSIVDSGAGRLELKRTRIWVEIEGKSEVVPALISDVISRVLIGVTTLEVLGLQADPLAGRLREWTLLLY